MQNVIDETYLPFTVESLKQHFTGDADRQLQYFRKSAERYHNFLTNNTVRTDIPVSKAKVPRQIEKDERFWTVTATKSIYDDLARDSLLMKLLSKTYGPTPPFSDISTWKACLEGDLRLYFEACLPAPRSYVVWLRSNINHRQMIPYVLDAANRTNLRTLEGATHVDALFLNQSNGFAWLIEAKVLSDISYTITFDNFRNQVIRNIDVMLETNSSLDSGLEKRDPNKSLFTLLTPRAFKGMPHSRLYGWLMQEYMINPDALKRDLSHRSNIDWLQLSRKIGWITFEDFDSVKPACCPWL